MEVESQILMVAGFCLESYHTTVLDLLLEQYVSTATLRVPQQGNSAVTYLMPMEPYSQHTWGYLPLVSVKEIGCVWIRDSGGVLLS